MVGWLWAARGYLRDVEVHWLVALPAGAGFHEARAASFDLHTTAGFGLDVLHVCTPVTDHLSSQVEAWDWFEIDGDLFLRPFAL